MSGQLAFLFETQTVSAWFAGHVPRSSWPEIGAPLGTIPGAPFVLNYDEKANPFPKRRPGRPRGTAWRKLSADPRFWAMPVYNLIRTAGRPVCADFVTMSLVSSEPVTKQSEPIVRALWRLVAHDWLCFRFVTTDDGTRIEFVVWSEDIEGVRLLPVDAATPESVADVRTRFPSSLNRRTHSRRTAGKLMKPVLLKLCLWLYADVRPDVGL